jgi:hypothetical protein
MARGVRRGCSHTGTARRAHRQTRHVRLRCVYATRPDHTLFNNAEGGNGGEEDKDLGQGRGKEGRREEDAQICLSCTLLFLLRSSEERCRLWVRDRGPAVNTPLRRENARWRCEGSSYFQSCVRPRESVCVVFRNRSVSKCRQSNVSERKRSETREQESTTHRTCFTVPG